MSMNHAHEVDHYENVRDRYQIKDDFLEEEEDDEHSSVCILQNRTVT